MSESDRSDFPSSDPGADVLTAEALYRETLQITHGLEARDRSWIARWVIVIFIASVAAALGTFVAEGVFTGRWDAVATQTFDLVRSAVLPVVTLILGYYFGRSAAYERPSRGESSTP